MKLHTKLFLAATGLLLTGLATWSILAPPVQAPEPVRAQQPVSPLTAGVAESEAEIADAERRELDAAGDEAPTADHLGSLSVHLIWHDTKAPAAGLPLHVIRERGLDGASIFEPGRLVLTGEDGTALVEGLHPGSFRILSNRMFHRGERGTSFGAVLDLTAGEAKVVEYEIPPGIDIQGRVVDRYGQPVPGAEILNAFKGFVPQRAFVIAVADSTGSFFIRALNNADALGARADGLGISDFVHVGSLDHVAGHPTSVTIRLPDEDPAAVDGMVFDPAGQPVRRARVTVGMGLLARVTLEEGRPGQLPPRSHLYTDDHGAFVVRDLRPGHTPVAVYRPGHAPWSGEIQLHAAEVTRLRVDLQPGTTISGVVRDSTGVPVRDIDVRVEPADYPFRAASRTDSRGHYEIRDLPAGEFEVIVAELAVTAGPLSGLYEPAKRSLTIAGPQEIEWDVSLEEGLSIQGILRDDQGRPLERWWLTREGDRYGAITDRDGRFKLGNLEQQGYTVNVYAQPSTLSPVVTHFDNLWPGEHHLTVPESALPSAHVEGRVLLPDGQPAQEASVALHFDDRGTSPSARTDQDGHFAFGPLPPGEYRLDASLPGLLVELGEVTLLPYQQLDLGAHMLQHGGALTVRLAATPEELDGVKVVLLDPEEDRAIRSANVSDDQAVFRLVAPGSYRLSVTPAGGQAHVQPVEIKAQETLEVTVTLR